MENIVLFCAAIGFFSCLFWAHIVNKCRSTNREIETLKREVVVLNENHNRLVVSHRDAITQLQDRCDQTNSMLTEQRLDIRRRLIAIGGNPCIGIDLGSEPDRTAVQLMCSHDSSMECDNCRPKRTGRKLDLE